MDGTRTDLWLQNLIDEREGEALYEGLAKAEDDPARARSFRELADGERRHAQIWENKLRQKGIAPPTHRVSKRTLLLLWLARRFGTSAVLSFVMANELGDADKYTQQGGDAAALAEDERSHERVLSGLAEGRTGEARTLIAGRERWHRLGRGGSIRAAVFGMNDGLVSNLSLVLGVAGAGVEPHTLLVTGFAGLLAGACSMAVGEFTSVSSQRDLLARQIAIERRELEEAPDEERAELVLILKQKGVSTEQAAATAAQMMKDPDAALDTLVREELGLDPGDLGSPWAAAGSSFATFATGALIPVLPFLFAQGFPAIVVSAALAGATLVGVGALIGVLSGTSIAKSIVRMVGLAALAAGATYGIGRLFGLSR